jgi:Transcriptional regulator/sugar kinase
VECPRDRGRPESRHDESTFRRGSHGSQGESPEHSSGDRFRGASELLDSVLERVAWDVVQGAVPVHAVIDPAVVVIGGGVAERLGERLIDAVDVEREKVSRDRRSEAFPEIQTGPSR